MASDTATASRSLGGRDALSSYRAERAEARLRLRASLRAGREALRGGRCSPVVVHPVDGPEAATPQVEASIFARMVDASGQVTDRASEPAANTDAAEAHDLPDTEPVGVEADAPHHTPLLDAGSPPCPSPPNDLTAIPELAPACGSGSLSSVSIPSTTSPAATLSSCAGTSGRSAASCASSDG
jgi:hypothetical protein